MAEKYTTAERVELVLLRGDNHRSFREVANVFHERHPEMRKPSPSTVFELVRKFIATGSVEDADRSGRPLTGTDDFSEIAVLATMSRSPVKSQRRISPKCNVSLSSVNRILQRHKFHPYVMHQVQELSEDDFDRRLEFCEWAHAMINENAMFYNTIIFSDEASFNLNGDVNRHNMRYYDDSNPHWFDQCHTQHNAKITVWCGIWGDRLIGPFFFEEDSVTGASYLAMLTTTILPALGDTTAALYQHDGAPAHFATAVRDFLNQCFPNRWIGRRGHVEWPPRSPDLTPLDFFLWGHLKSVVYQSRVRTIQELQDRIRAVCSTVTQQMLENVSRSWCRRINMCVEVLGHHFEQLL